MKNLTGSLTLLALALAAGGCTLEVDTSNTGYAAGMIGGAAGGERRVGANAATNGDSRAVASRVVTVVAVLLRAQTPQGEQRIAVARGSLTVLTTRTLAAAQVTGGTLVVSNEVVLGEGRSRWRVQSGSVALAGVTGECGVRAGGELVVTRDVDGVWAIAEGNTSLDDTVTVATGLTTTTAGAGGSVATGGGAGGALVVAPEDNGTAAGAAGALDAGAGAAGGARVTASVSVPATVARIGAGAAAGVVVGGRVTLAGMPDAAALEVIDGDVQFTPVAAGAGGSGSGATVTMGAGTACWRATGGTLLVAARGGRRFRVRVTAGQLVLRGAGRGTSGQAFWSAAGGELAVRVVAEGGATLALNDAVATGARAGFGTPVVNASVGAGGGAAATATATATTPAAPPPVLTARTRNALDLLVSLAPAGNHAAVRQQTAVDLIEQTTGSAAGVSAADSLLYNTPIVGRSVVLVVDLSYSMSELVPEFRGRSFDPRVAPTKLDIARAELVKVLSALPAGTTVSIVGFSSDLHTLWAQPRTVDDAALDAAVRWVAALRPLDETEPVAALRAAETMRADQVVLISDGRPTQVSESEAALLSLADGIARRGARLDAVGVGSDQDESFLATLAGRGHGCARHW